LGRGVLADPKWRICHCFQLKGTSRMTKGRSQRLDINLNLNVRELPASATIGINQMCNDLIREGKKATTRSSASQGLGTWVTSMAPEPQPAEPK
jgi:hypothetical protein